MNSALEQDAALILRARRGDPLAYRALFDRHLDGVLRLARSYTGQDDEAQDLAQEAFVSIFAALDRFDPTRPFRPWLMQAVLNKCRDWSRRRAVRKLFAFARPMEDLHDVASETPGLDREAIAAETLRRARRAIAELPDVLKAPLILTAIEGHSQAEVAAMLGVSEKAIETRVRRARHQLTNALGLTDGDEG